MSLLDLALLTPHGIVVTSSTADGIAAMGNGDPTTCEERNAIVATLAAARDVFARPPTDSVTTGAVVGLLGETFVSGDATLRATSSSDDHAVLDYLVIGTNERRRAWEEAGLLLHGLALEPDHIVPAAPVDTAPATVVVEIVGQSALAASIYSSGHPLGTVVGRRIATPRPVATVVAARLPQLAAFAARLRSARTTGRIATDSIEPPSDLATCMETQWRGEITASTTRGLALAAGTAFGVGATAWVGARALKRIRGLLSGNSAMVTT